MPVDEHSLKIMVPGFGHHEAPHFGENKNNKTDMEVAMKAENYSNEGISLEQKEDLAEARKILAFVRLAVSTAPIALEGEAQDGFVIVLDDVRKRLER